MTTSNPYNEQELLQQLAAGSESAFEILFQAYKDKLYTYLLKLSGSSEAAEDTVHEVFLKLWTKKEDLLQVDNLNAYIYSIARNHSYNLFRRMAKETLILSEIARDQANETGLEGEERITHQEVLETIHAAVNQLTPQQKQVFYLSREQGLKLKEIADQLGITERTAKNHITEALKFLREEIGHLYGHNAVIIFVLYNLSDL